MRTTERVVMFTVNACFHRKSVVLGIDFGVWLALMLSLASAVLCVGYGVIRWNVHDDSDSDPSARDRPTVESARETKEGREEV